MSRHGIIFNIQRFSTHDGPGIRTTVFLKGCPLTCLWCSNPESQYGRPQLMVRDVKCSGCGECVSACPEHAISFSEEQTRKINWNRCNNCFDCVGACLYGSLTSIGEQMTSEAVADIVEKDTVFYNNSGGGVTISGGEAFAQHDFLEELLILLKQKKIHRALDTTGYAPASVIDKIIPLVDMVLFDIKHLDTERHREATGVRNENILKNLRRVARQIRTWIRIPLIAGYNDTEAHITKISELAEELKIEKVSFLPYHEGGTVKHRQIGQKHPEFSAKAPTEEHLKWILEIMARKNIPATIGS